MDPVVVAGALGSFLQTLLSAATGRPVVRVKTSPTCDLLLTQDNDEPIKWNAEVILALRQFELDRCEGLKYAFGASVICCDETGGERKTTSLGELKNATRYEELRGTATIPLSILVDSPTANTSDYKVTAWVKVGKRTKRVYEGHPTSVHVSNRSSARIRRRK